MRTPQLVVMLILTLGLAPQRATASGGDLDPTFGDGGVLDVRFTPSGGGHQVALGPGGTLVGMLGDIPRYLYRLLPDGTPDPTFGTDGFVELAGSEYRYNAMTIAADGSVIVVGAFNPVFPVYEMF